MRITIILFFILKISLSSFGQNWLADYDMVLKIAKAENKNILINFSGSDWCIPCIKMKRDIFSQSKFIEYSNNNLVMYNADFPRAKKKQPNISVKNINDALTEQYNKSGTFPYTVMLDPQGKVLKTWEGLPKYNVDEFLSDMLKL